MQSVFTPPTAAPVVRGSRGATYAPSSFGIDETTFGPGFRPKLFTESERAVFLRFCASYYTCTQHDWKVWDFDGRYQRGGLQVQGSPLIGASMPSHYVPLNQRRPSAPYRIAYTIVERFTSLIFGDQHFPEVECEGDPDTADFAAALCEAQDLPSVMVRARSLGGSRGTVGLSWRFFEGKPVCSVHRAENLHVHEWRDFEQLIPEHVTELLQVARDVYDRDKQRVERRWFWQRRDWTPQADVVFKEVPCDEESPEWVIDEDRLVEHGDGEAHFVWIQNLPDDDEGTRVDGRSDYDNLWENCNTLDVLNSVVARGGICNLDPTLVLSLDPELAKRGVKKGSDNALIVGTDGSASYLTLPSDMVTAGNALIARERAQILEVAQCVILDPDQAIAAGASSLVVELEYLPMLSKCGLMRTQYGQRGMVRLLEQQVRSARRMLPEEGEGGELQYPTELVVDEETGIEVERPVEYTLDLPPKVVEVQVLDADGNPTEEKATRLVQRRLGKGARLTLKWPPFFPPTEQEKQAQVQTLTTATGGRAVMSQQDAVEEWAKASGKDPTLAWQRYQAEQQVERERTAFNMPGVGGELPPAVSDRSDTPPAEPVLPEPEPRPLPGAPAAGDVPEEEKPREETHPTVRTFMVGELTVASQIVAQVTAGEIPRDAGIGMLTVLLKLEPGQALAILGSAGTGKPAVANPVQEGGAPKPVQPTAVPAQGGQDASGAPGGGEGPPPPLRFPELG